MQSSLNMQRKSNQSIKRTRKLNYRISNYTSDTEDMKNTIKQLHLYNMYRIIRRTANNILGCSWNIHYGHILGHKVILNFYYFYFLLSFFFFPRAAPMAYGGSQARGIIGAVCTGLCHSNTGSELHL